MSAANVLYENEGNKTLSHHVEEKDRDLQGAAADGVETKLDAMLASHLEGSNLEERQTALRLAMDADPGLDPLSWRGLKFWLICLLICMSPGDWGFDGTVIASINSMEQYRDFFDLASEATTKTGVIFGIGVAGTIVAFVPSYYVPDRIGRRWAMFLGNIPSIIGAFLSGFARNYNELLAARIIGGLGFSGAAPQAYLAETAPPSQRGRIMGFFNSCYYFGQILATGICIPFGKTTSNWAWRVPFILQAVPLIILMMFVLFIPESPRWLYARGRREESVQVLAQLHSRTGDVNSPLIRLEMEEIAAQISLDGGDKRWWDFRPLFKTRNETYRFLLGVVNMVWSYLAGNGLISFWLPVLINNAGITDTNRQRVLTFANSITSLAGAMAGVAVVDKVGRRPLMLFATGACGIGMAICAGLLNPHGPQTKTRVNAGISFLMLFMVVYSIGWTPLQSLYPTEVLSFENRQKGNALRGLISIALNCFNNFALPALLNTISWKTYLIFVAFDAIGFVIIWLFAVETKQLSLEDLDEVFNSKNPKKTSLQLVQQGKMLQSRRSLPTSISV